MTVTLEELTSEFFAITGTKPIVDGELSEGFSFDYEKNRIYGLSKTVNVDSADHELFLFETNDSNKIHNREIMNNSGVEEPPFAIMGLFNCLGHLVFNQISDTKLNSPCYCGEDIDIVPFIDLKKRKVGLDFFVQRDGKQVSTFSPMYLSSSKPVHESGDYIFSNQKNLVELSLDIETKPHLVALAQVSDFLLYSMGELGKQEVIDGVKKSISKINSQLVGGEDKALIAEKDVLVKKLDFSSHLRDFLEFNFAPMYTKFGVEFLVLS